MKTIITGLLVLSLLILHQDYWNWDNGTLVYGFIPYSLAYHSVICVVTAVVWSLVVTVLWPNQPSDFTSAQEDEA